MLNGYWSSCKSNVVMEAAMKSFKRLKVFSSMLFACRFCLCNLIQNIVFLILACSPCVLLLQKYVDEQSVKLMAMKNQSDDLSNLKPFNDRLNKMSENVSSLQVCHDF